MNDGAFQYKLVVAVRSDLKLSPGKVAVQVAHAAVTCALQCRERDRRTFDAWFAEGQRKVVVKVSSKEEIFELQRQAQAKGLVSSVIEDAGLTEIPPGTVTCVGIGPARETEIDPLTRKLQLM